MRGGILKRVKIFVGIITISFFVCGCILGRGNRALVKPAENGLVGNQGLVIGKTVESRRLQQGGNLLIIPFVAGQGVAATDSLGKMALMVVRGVADALQAQKISFRILGESNAESADLIMRGRITKFKKSSSFKKWFGQKPRTQFWVEGKVVDVKGENIILYFSHHAEAESASANDQHVAYQAGQAIGQFILAQLKTPS